MRDESNKLVYKEAYSIDNTNFSRMNVLTCQVSLISAKASNH